MEDVLDESGLSRYAAVVLGLGLESVPSKDLMESTSTLESTHYSFISISSRK
jgi:hypothetical protein